jgi:hypothetical protein
MKKLFTLLFIIQILLVKAQEKKLDKNSVQTIIGVIDKRDTNCLTEIKQAKIDFKTQEIFYELIPEGYLDSDYNRHYPQLIRLLKEKGIKIIGTDYESMDLSEDRGSFSDLLKELDIPYPQYGVAEDAEEAIKVAN